jgi:phosphoglycerate dehydrogenase-like enzyme
MKLVLYGSFPASEADRIGGYLTSAWELTPVVNEAPAEEKRESLANCEVMVTSVYRSRDPPAPKLRLLQCSSTGTERIDLGHLPSGCVVCNVHGHEIAIAEYATCALLDWAIGYGSLAAAFRDGTWTLAEWVDGANHGEAFGKTLGLVGFGRIGREIAIRARALGMHVAALSAWRSAPPDRALVDRAYRRDDWRALAEAADYLVVCCPLTAETRGMVDAAWFAAMKPSAVVINVARGPVIDEAAFYAALAERRIRGATIDVWYKYPPVSGERVRASQFAFHELPNAVMTRHASAHTEETWERRFKAIAENLEAFAHGRPLANVISENRRGGSQDKKRGRHQVS